MKYNYQQYIEGLLFELEYSGFDLRYLGFDNELVLREISEVYKKAKKYEKLEAVINERSINESENERSVNEKNRNVAIATITMHKLIEDVRSMYGVNILLPKNDVYSQIINETNEVILYLAECEEQTPRTHRIYEMKDKISTMVRVERNYYNVTDVVLHVRDDMSELPDGDVYFNIKGEYARRRKS